MFCAQCSLDQTVASSTQVPWQQQAEQGEFMIEKAEQIEHVGKRTMSDTGTAISGMTEAAPSSAGTDQHHQRRARSPLDNVCTTAKERKKKKKIDRSRTKSWIRSR